jgi:hypothetical protein
MTRKSKDKPYIDNYPPLKEWLNKHEARCYWQFPLGDVDNPTAFVEQWRIGANVVVVIVRADQMGWDIYLPCKSHMIDETFAEVEDRLGLKPGKGE